MAHYYPLFDYFDLEKMGKRCRKLERLYIAEYVDNVQYVLFTISFGEKKTSLMCSGNFFFGRPGKHMAISPRNFDFGKMGEGCRTLRR
jgi:hypothetical protein